MRIETLIAVLLGLVLLTSIFGAEEPEPSITYYDIGYYEEKPLYALDDYREYTLEEAKERAIQFEGFSSTPYKFRGTWHIGYGTTVPDATAIDYITQEDAYSMLHRDMVYFHEKLTTDWPDYLSAPEEIQVVLLDMAYNMGMPNLMTFTKMQMCDVVECFQHQIADSLYAEQVPNRAQANIEYLEGL